MFDFNIASGEERSVGDAEAVSSAGKIRLYFGGAMTGSGFFAVGLGAALGAWSRWLLGMGLNPIFVAVPLGTLAANLMGGYLIGVAVGVFHLNSGLPPALKLFAITGFLGGHDFLQLFRRSRRAHAGGPARLGDRPGLPASGRFADGYLPGAADRWRHAHLVLNCCLPCRPKAGVLID
jgi:CrcB protein